METQKLCSVISCNNHLESKISVPPIMFEFPSRSDPRYEKWCNEIERNDLLTKEAEAETHFVCINHFEPKMYYFEEVFRLHDWAMPSLLKKEVVPSFMDNLTENAMILPIVHSSTHQVRFY